jgi:hypothetical protein
VQADPWLELTEWIPHLKSFLRAVLLRAREPARGEAGEDSGEEEMADEMGLESLQGYAATDTESVWKLLRRDCWQACSRDYRATRSGR